MSKKKTVKEHKDKKAADKKGAEKSKKTTVKVVLPPLPSLVAVPAPAVPAAPVAPAEKSAKKQAVAEKLPKKATKRAASAKKDASHGPVPAITADDIGLRAYYIAERRQKMGWPGDSAGDWIEAERQLVAEAKKKK